MLKSTFVSSKAGCNAGFYLSNRDWCKVTNQIFKHEEKISIIYRMLLTTTTILATISKLVTMMHSQICLFMWPCRKMCEHERSEDNGGQDMGCFLTIDALRMLHLKISEHSSWNVHAHCYVSSSGDTCLKKYAFHRQDGQTWCMNQSKAYESTLAKL